MVSMESNPASSAAIAAASSWFGEYCSVPAFQPNLIAVVCMMILSSKRHATRFTIKTSFRVRRVAKKNAKLFTIKLPDQIPTAPQQHCGLKSRDCRKYLPIDSSKARFTLTEPRILPGIRIAQVVLTNMVKYFQINHDYYAVATRYGH